MECLLVQTLQPILIKMYCTAANGISHFWIQCFVNIVDKKLGSITYHYGNKKSAKAYHTYDYPEIYYGKKMYSSVAQWLKEEFSTKI